MSTKQSGEFNCVADNPPRAQNIWRHIIFIAFVALVALSGTAHDAVAETSTQMTLNPYASVDWDHVEHYKMNLHTHTTESDGQVRPQQVIDEYHSRGYHALAITDHDRCTWPWTAYDREPAMLNMLAIPGNELSRHHHTLSLFTDYETEERDHYMALAGVLEAGGVAILCHPAMHWLREHDAAPSLHVPLTPTLRTLPQEEFTIETWFRTKDADRNIMLGNYSGQYEGAINLELHTNNRIRLYVQPADEGRTVDINVSADTLGIDTRDGQWHHLAGLRRGDTLFLYLDGQQIGERKDRAGAYVLAGDALFIGRDTRTGATAFTGDLAGTALWRRALGEDEIAARFSGTPIAKDDLLALYAFTAAPGPGFAEISGTPEGPFHASTAGDIPPESVADIPAALRALHADAMALRFDAGEFPKTMPDTFVERYIALFKHHPHLLGMEIHNRTRPEREYPLDRDLWDRLLTALMPHRPVWGVATDDMHRMHHLGGDWVVAPLPKLDERTARAALTEGAYYFATTRLHGAEKGNVAGTPCIDRVVHDAHAGQIIVTANIAGEALPDSAYTWISEGRTVHTGPMLPYRTLPELGVYARVEITGQGGTAYLNPFGFQL